MTSSNASKACAYCGSSGAFTREHVISKFLYRDYPEQKFGYHPQADRYLTHEAVVRDVCQGCNTGPLSQLDNYGRDFVEMNRCYRQFRTRTEIVLRYEYDELMRWLLKISYNAMRATHRDTSDILPWVPFILGGGKRPSSAEVFVEVVRDHPISVEDRNSLAGNLKGARWLPSLRFRVGGVSGLAPYGRAAARYVTINAFYFYVFWAIPGTGDVAAALQAFRRAVPQAYRLSPGATYRRFRVSKRTVADAMRDQALVEMPAWKRHVTEQKRRQKPDGIDK
jgi:hypothetical protein